ncbi:hypothetical protein FIE12Z_10626 [Fusarium flagelliforme]|uniref:Uncharacterized protein n=1 Tax=Fusarium flagelliforme TaxID=2675880 RepID=A0A395MDD8_9HYPO|nr:hypothetical protein FIE12Z_10626 [Fusarium flagelliforme]
MAGEEDTRPVKSPSAGRQAVLHFHGETEESQLRIPFNILEPYEELTRKRKRDEAETSDAPSCEEFDLTDTPSSQINLLSIITAIERGKPISNTLFGTFYPGIAKYLRFKVQSFVQNATEAEAKGMLAKLKTSNAMGKILLQNLMLMKLSTVPKPEEGTGAKTNDAPATKNSGKLAEEVILEAEDAHQKAQEESNRRFRKAMEKTKARKGMGEAYQGQPRAD